MSSNQVARRSSSAPALRRRNAYEQAIEGIHGETAVQVTAQRALAGVGDQAMYDVTQVKQTQRQLEQMNPDAAEAIAIIANTTCMAIARSVARFGYDIGG